MIGDFTFFRDGGWAGGGFMQSGESTAELAYALRRSARAYLDDGDAEIGRALIEIENGDVWLYEVVDLDALRALARLVAFLEEA